MASAEQHIVTSTGGLGVGRRPSPDDRLYINAPTLVDNTEKFMVGVDRVSKLHERRDKISKGTTRTVFRGVVSADVWEQVRPMHGLLETALPLNEFTGDDSWLVTLAKNGELRKPKVSREEIQIATPDRVKEITKPSERIDALTKEGFTFSSKIHDEDVDEIVKLWGPTFGWTKKAVQVLQSRLRAGDIIDKENRDVWYTSLRNPDGKMISLAFTEKLQRPGADGKMIDTIESTDWFVHKDYRENGFMSATLGMLNAQVLSDIANPLIYAECNFTTRADISGAAVGFKIPPREYAPQVLFQNAIVDGEPREFSFMYLPKSVIDEHYSPEARAAMTAHLNPVKV